jgi:hypothetical protein
MTFLQPLILWGLPLVLLPVIIHLINRMRHRPRQWAAMQFLLAATRHSTSHARLRNLLILLMRILAVLTLCCSSPGRLSAAGLAGRWLPRRMPSYCSSTAPPAWSRASPVRTSHAVNTR